MTQDVALTPPIPPSDPRRWVKSSAIAINGSGAGLGAFAGPEPRQVVATPPMGGFGPAHAAVLTPGATLGVSTPTPAAVFTPLSMEYVPGLDRFAVVESDSPSPGAPTVVSFRPHTPDALLEADSSFTIDGLAGVKGLSNLSAPYASALTGADIDEPALLLLARNNVGMIQYPELFIVTYDGEVLSQTTLMLPGTDNPDTTVTNPFAIAVDEVNGLVFVSDRATARVYVIDTPGVPGPAGAGLLALGAVAVVRRRR